MPDGWYHGIRGGDRRPILQPIDRNAKIGNEIRHNSPLFEYSVLSEQHGRTKMGSWKLWISRPGANSHLKRGIYKLDKVKIVNSEQEI